LTGIVHAEWIDKMSELSKLAMKLMRLNLVTSAETLAQLFS